MRRPFCLDAMLAACRVGGLGADEAVASAPKPDLEMEELVKVRLLLLLTAFRI